MWAGVIDSDLDTWRSRCLVEECLSNEGFDVEESLPSGGVSV